MFRIIGKPQDAEVKASDERHGKDRDGEGDIKRPGQIHDDELLDALDGEEVEPTPEFGAVCSYGATSEVHATEGPRVYL